MKDWYTWILLATLGWIGWINLTGGGHSDGQKARLTPNVRNNRGSYRSHYSHSFFHVGGK